VVLHSGVKGKSADHHRLFLFGGAQLEQHESPPQLSSAPH
jgi:hypothetical protein